MTVQTRASCKAVTCDRPGCHSEQLGPTAEDAVSDAVAAGWQVVAGGGHACADCVAGRSTAEARAQATFGVSRVIVRAERDYAEGEAVRGEDGVEVGRAAAAAKAGAPLEIVLRAPTAPTRRGDKPRREPLAIEAAPWKPPWAGERPS